MPHARAIDRLRDVPRPPSPFLLALLATAIACDEGTAPAPKVELYIDSTLAGATPAIGFPPTPAGSDGIAAQLEVKNLGPSALVLTGSPPVLLERDDRLAFRVTQPPKTRFAAGESFVVSVVFAPHSPGSSFARLVIPTDHVESSLVVALAGEGIASAAPELVATIDGTPLTSPGARFDFGAVPTLEVREANLRLANGGDAPLELGASPLALTGTDAAAFELGTLGAPSLAAGEHVDVSLSFTPDACRAFEATLTIAHAGSDATLDVTLLGRGGENPQGHAGATDVELLDAPDLDVTLSGADANGRRRFAVGNLTVGGYSGQVGLFAWDGCVLSGARTISAASSGLTAQLFGHQVALTDDGATLLVTARDQQKDAWLFAIGADGEPRFLATLATFDQGGGHGRGAAIAGDGSAVFIGQTLADSGFNAHGAVFAYERPGGGWVSAPEARFRLGPLAPTQVELIGSSVEASRDGDVVISGALQTPVGAASKGPAAVYVWEATRDDADGRRWGREIPLGEPNQRTESFRLTSAQVPSDGVARVAISADGNTIALSTVREDDVQIRLFVRVGDEPWGRPTASPDERSATALLTLTATPALRLALGPAGDFLLAADQGGAREIPRPASGWGDDASIAKTWNVPFYGALSVSPDGAAFAGMDKAGAAWFVFR